MRFAIVRGGCEATKPGLKATPRVTVGALALAGDAYSCPADGSVEVYPVTARCVLTDRGIIALTKSMDQAIADGWNPGFARAWSTQDEGQAVMMRLCSLLTAVLCAVAPAYAQKRAFTLEDLYRVRSIGDLQVSPDGTRAAYTVTTSDLPRGKRTTHIWLLEMASGQSRQLTFSDSSSSPVFSPDGKSLAFVTTRDGDANLYLLPLDGGEARPLTHISTGVSDPVWSPDGKRIAFSSDVYPECADDACNKKIAETWQKGTLKAHMADALFYRHWTAWKDGTRTHIFLADVSGARRRRPRSHARQLRLAVVPARRPAAVRLRARQLRIVLRVEPRAAARQFHQQRSVAAVARGARRAAAKHHGRQPGVRRQPEVLAGWPVHRVPDAEAARLRVRSVSTRCLRSAGRHVGSAHRGVSRLGLRVRLEPRLEVDRLPGRGARRDAHLPARRREQAHREAARRQDD